MLKLILAEGILTLAGTDLDLEQFMDTIVEGPTSKVNMSLELPEELHDQVFIIEQIKVLVE